MKAEIERDDISTHAPEYNQVRHALHIMPENETERLALECLNREYKDLRVWVSELGDFYHEDVIGRGQAERIGQVLLLHCKEPPQNWTSAGVNDSNPAVQSDQKPESLIRMVNKKGDIGTERLRVILLPDAILQKLLKGGTY